MAFLDRVGDVEALTLAVDIGRRRHDAHVGVAVLEIELAHELAIEVDPIRVVNAVALEEVEPARLARRDDVAELAVGERAVTDEVDALDLRLPAFVDLEHEVDAVLRQLDDLRFDARGESTLTAIDVEDTLHVRLHLGAGENRARLQLHLALEARLLDLAVTLKCDAINDRILDHRDDQSRAGAIDAHIAEEPRREQRLQGLVDLCRIVGVADGNGQIGANRLGFDAPVPLDANLADDNGLRHRGLRGDHRRAGPCGGNPEHEGKASESAPQELCPTQWHSLMPPLDLRRIPQQSSAPAMS